MDKQKRRDEISNEYKWDLTSIFKTDEDYYCMLEVVKKDLNLFDCFKEDLLTSAKRLLEYLETKITFERKLYRLYFYAHLNLDADTTNTQYQKMDKEITDLMSKFSENISFVNPLFMETNYEVIKNFYEEEPALKKHKFNIDNLYRFKNHTLSKDAEKLISSMNKVFENPSETYSILTDTDLKFDTIIAEDGKEVELTESNYRKYISSIDRSVRKNAFEKLFKVYKSFKNTITSIYNGDIDSSIAISKIRKYNSSLEASLYTDNVEINVYNNLIDTVNNNLFVLHKYFETVKNVLKLDELHLYDLYVPLIKEDKSYYEYDEARKTVISALSILGEDYIENLNKAFDQKWIDVYNNVGKRGGAYSSGFYDTNPYILLNYEGKLNDVSTLAHELGHSMHSYYSCKNNEYQNSSYTIFVAEVASTVNELLLCKHLLKESKDKNEKLSILNRLMELFKSTIYRQTMFAEFEKGIYEKRENDEVLTHEVISNYYYDLNKKYFGSNIVVDELISYEWERIPHFYYNFYVYKYATGLSAACYIVESIINNKENALENYLSFLKTGGSDYPIEELKIAHVDMNDKKVVESAIKMFNETIDEFNKLNNS